MNTLKVVRLKSWEYKMVISWKKMNLFLLCAFSSLLFFSYSNTTIAMPFHAKEKKVILFSGGGGTTGDIFAPDIISRISKLDSLPIDGIYFKPKKRTLMNGFIPLFDNQVWNETQFDMTAMSQIQWGRVKDNGFLTFTQYSLVPDWWNDAQWNTICTNMRLLSKAMKTAKVTNILFDCEYYGEWQTPPFFDYATYPGHTATELTAKVRQRGAEFMKALQTEIPDGVQLVSVYANYGTSGWYGLVPAFADGCLSVGGPNAVFVDGIEYMYYKFEPRAYFTDYAGRNGVAPRVKYPNSYLLGYPVYWNPMTQVGDANYQAKWQEQTYYMTALTADQYVWVFTEGVNWLKGAMNPTAYNAFTSARTKLAQGKPLGFNLFKKSGTDWNAWRDPTTVQIITSPTANIASPLNNAKFASGSKLTVNVDVTGTASKVSLYVNSINKGTDATAPYSFDLSGLGDGYYTIVAMVFGSDGDTHNTSNPVTIAMGNVSSIIPNGQIRLAETSPVIDIRNDYAGQLFLNIPAANGLHIIKIYDLTGKTLYSAEGNGKSQYAIPMAQHSSGMYLLSIANGNARSTFKVPVY